ncbi:tetratricopeptide repeat protein [Amphiplicatus metriothermophilus]|uniref:Tetratricopeptide repeat-containing protein n=1 Tax=Amphiplicatus metriothermophilus TaxID=1519374 RepID=A0A239Q0T0_9PROT|nr:tetratricopeptide repeat protein [Amphiplicatus metriothermophilus]MBB5520039.1 tetratricopeptide (TPR) repeat protein [Amphiplicatus metriothermophilus]SNT75802.1 Tetratricopeptide repeat-containing protein [Amphiplicatus metriothermophilus]
MHRNSERRISRALGALAAAVFGAAALLYAPAILAAPSGGSSLPSTTPQRQVDPAASYREGLEALEREDYRTAEKKFGEVLSVLPKNPEANYHMGLAKIGRGKTKSSVRYFERAIRERPSYTEARERLALVQIELGEPDEAREQLDAMKAQLEACGAGDECGAGRRARLEEAIARVEAALAGGEQAARGMASRPAGLFAQPRAAGAERYRDAVRLINEAEYEAAIADLYAAQAIVGPHPDILNYLGFAHRKLARFDEARRYYAQALAIDPDHLGANEYLGELYLELGDTQKARAQLARLDALCPFGCAEREDLARLIDRRESDRRARR